MRYFDIKMKERVKEFLFYKNAWYAPHHRSWYADKPEELRTIKRRYRKILRKARSIVRYSLGDYETIYLAYGLSKYSNVIKGKRK